MWVNCYENTLKKCSLNKISRFETFSNCANSKSLSFRAHTHEMLLSQKLAGNFHTTYKTV